MKKKKENKKLKVNIKIRFQEILAMTVIIPFLIFTIMVLTGERDYHIIQIYVPLISIILGGYFGQGAIREWRSHQEQIETPLMEYRPDGPAYEDQRYEEQQQEYQQEEVDPNRPPI